MNKIEFIGASGTGKSTLFQKVADSREKADRWITPAEGRIRLARNLSYKRSKSGLYLFLLTAIKMNLFKKSHPTIAAFLLQKSRGEEAGEELHRYEDLIAMLLEAIAKDPQIEAFRKGQFIQFYMNLLIMDLLMLETLEKEQLVVYDDGVIHNSDFFVDEHHFYQQLLIHQEQLNKILPNGVVFCELEAEEVFSRRKKRIAAGRGTMLEANLSDEKLWRDCCESIKESRKAVDFLEKIGIPVLRIDMNAAENRNIPLIHSFIREVAGKTEKKIELFREQRLLEAAEK